MDFYVGAFHVQSTEERCSVCMFVVILNVCGIHSSFCVRKINMIISRKPSVVPLTSVGGRVAKA